MVSVFSFLYNEFCVVTTIFLQSSHHSQWPPPSNHLFCCLWSRRGRLLTDARMRDCLQSGQLPSGYTPEENISPSPSNCLLNKQPQEEAASQALPTPCQMMTGPGHLLTQASCRYPVSLALPCQGWPFRALVTTDISPQEREECPNSKELAGKGQELPRVASGKPSHYRNVH